MPRIDRSAPLALALALALLALLAPRDSHAQAPEAKAPETPQAGDAAQADQPPLRLLIAGDTQIQTLKGGKVVGQIGQLEDRIVKVSQRPPALRLLSPLALRELLTTRVQAKKLEFDAILYLGDGANSGCQDEIDLLFETLTAVRDQVNKPIFIVPGNHDYLGSGNTNDPNDRDEACDRSDEKRKPVRNKPLSKGEVIQRIDAFNRAEDLNGWSYASNIDAAATACGDPTLPPHQDKRPGCFLAGLITRDDIRILLTDTSDYAGAKPSKLVDAYRGIRGARSAAQRKWFADQLTAGPRERLRIVASHYPLSEPADRADLVCADCKKTLWLSAHTHTRDPQKTETETAKDFVYNVGSTTDHRPHIAHLTIGQQVDPQAIYLGDLDDPDDKACQGFVAGLERGGIRPWRVQPVADQTHGLAVYGLDRTYQAFYWTDEHTEQAAANVAYLLAWHRGTPPADDITSGEGRSALAPNGPNAPAQPAQMTWSELIICLATTAARLEDEPMHFDQPARVQVDERALYAAADLRMRAGDAQRPGDLDAPWDPTYDGVLTAGLDWSHRIRIETGLRIVGEAGDAETPRVWDVELDAASVHMGDHSPTSDTTYGFTGGHLPLTLGHGSLLDASEWLVRPPRFDGIDAAAGWQGFAMRAGAFEAPGGAGGRAADARQLYLLSLGYCHDTGKNDTGKKPAPSTPAPGAHHGMPGACLADDRIEAAIDGLVLADADEALWNAGVRIAAQGKGGPINWRLAGETHVQIDGGLGEPAPGDRYLALQAAARSRLGWSLGVVGIDAGFGYEWLSAQGDRLAAFDPLYGRRHDRFGPGDLINAWPATLGGEGLHALTVDAALRLPSSIISEGRIGPRYSELVGLGRDMALVIDLKFRVMRFELRGGRRSLGAEQSARSGVGDGEWVDGYGLALIEAAM